MYSRRCSVSMARMTNGRGRDRAAVNVEGVIEGQKVCQERARGYVQQGVVVYQHDLTALNFPGIRKFVACSCGGRARVTRTKFHHTHSKSPSHTACCALLSYEHVTTLLVLCPLLLRLAI